MKWRQLDLAVSMPLLGVGGGRGGPLNSKNNNNNNNSSYLLNMKHSLNVKIIPFDPHESLGVDSLITTLQLGKPKLKEGTSQGHTSQSTQTLVSPVPKHMLL